jgi:1,4-alpha-glucan branching enzyme
MLYLDYSRQHWVPNESGGRENLAAMSFFRELNAMVHAGHPGVLMVAEESSAWPRVTGPGREDSLGFDYKWCLGWMHDTLGYLGRDPVHRRFHHNEITFSMVYAFTEHFLLPLSHDEVVHGKRSLLSKMPGDEWQRFANLRVLYAFMFAHPGKKLLFMGAEFGVEREWAFAGELDWALAVKPEGRGLSSLVAALNKLYREHLALHEVDVGWEGFQWLNCANAEEGTLSFVRRSKGGLRHLLCIVNFTPVVRELHRVGVPLPGAYKVVLNTDEACYGGGGVPVGDTLSAQALPRDGQSFSLALNLPPLAAVYLEPVAEEARS